MIVIKLLLQFTYLIIFIKILNKVDSALTFYLLSLYLASQLLSYMITKKQEKETIKILTNIIDKTAYPNKTPKDYN